MRVWLWLLLYPLNLWNRFGGNCTKFFKLYERFCWQPFLRRWLNGGVELRRQCSEINECERCEAPLIGTEVPVTLSRHEGSLDFCDHSYRDEWFAAGIPNMRSTELISVPLSVRLKSKSKYWRKHNLSQGWILIAFIICIMCSAGCASLSSFARITKEVDKENTNIASDVLRDVVVEEQNDSTKILLVGSHGMSYAVFKSIDPLELVVDLPNTISDTVTTNFAVDNEIISKIEILNFTAGSTFMIRVKIGLNRETPYRVIQEHNQVNIHLKKTDLLTNSEQTQTEPAAGSEIKVLSSRAKMGQTASNSQSSVRESMSFSLADERKPLFPASKILSIQSLIMNQELRFYILADGNLANFNIFHLTDPPRVVVDLMGVRTTETPDVWTLSGPMVSKVKISLNEDKVRVVFGLLNKAGLPYKVSTEGDTLRISFTPGSGFPSP